VNRLEGLGVGQFVEELYLYWTEHNTTLAPSERDCVIEFVMTFEECSHTVSELRSMDDQDLIASAYWVMADYARGQM